MTRSARRLTAVEDAEEETAPALSIVENGRPAHVEPILEASDESDDSEWDPVVFGPPLEEYTVTVVIDRIEPGRPLLVPEDWIE